MFLPTPPCGRPLAGTAAKPNLLLPVFRRQSFLLPPSRAAHHRSESRSAYAEQDEALVQSATATRLAETGVFDAALDVAKRIWACRPVRADGWARCVEDYSIRSRSLADIAILLAGAGKVGLALETIDAIGGSWASHERTDGGRTRPRAPQEAVDSQRDPPGAVWHAYCSGPRGVPHHVPSG